MKKKSIIITLIATIPILIMSGVILASPNGACMKFRHVNSAMANMPFGNSMGPPFRILEGLKLSKEQREKIWSIQDKIRPQIRTHRLALFEGHKQLREIVNSDYDQKKIQKLANEQGSTTITLIMIQTDTRHRIQSVLTPEQRDQLKEFRSRGNMGLQRTEKPWIR